MSMRLRSRQPRSTTVKPNLDRWILGVDVRKLGCSHSRASQCEIDEAVKVNGRAKGKKSSPKKELSAMEQIA